MARTLRERIAAAARPAKPYRRCLICGGPPDAGVHRRDHDRPSNVAPRGVGIIIAGGRKATTYNGILYLLHPYDPGERRTGPATRREGKLPMPASRRHHDPGPVGTASAHRPTGGE